MMPFSDSVHTGLHISSVISQMRQVFSQIESQGEMGLFTENVSHRFQVGGVGFGISGSGLGIPALWSPGKSNSEGQIFKGWQNEIPKCCLGRPGKINPEVENFGQGQIFDRPEKSGIRKALPRKDQPGRSNFWPSRERVNPEGQNFDFRENWTREVEILPFWVKLQPEIQIFVVPEKSQIRRVNFCFSGEKQNPEGHGLGFRV